MNMARDSWSFGAPHRAVPREGATTARLSIPHGIDRASFRALAAEAGYRVVEPLVELWFDGEPLAVEALGSDVRVGERRSFFGARPRMRVDLNGEVEWSIAVGGAAHLLADLAEVAVRELSFGGGASDVRLRLGKRPGATVISIFGGASDVEIVRPVGVALRVAVRGGASEVALDALKLGAIGGHLAWQSPDWDEATARLDLQIDGGVSDLRVGAVP
jgi:hypothetical protein